jgi:hypothetical protein
MASNNLIKLIGMTAQITGKELDADAIEVFAFHLSPFPEEQAAKALIQCQRECKRPFTLADVLERLDDGRPSAIVAWGKITWDEWLTVIATDEMLTAQSVAGDLWRSGDKGGAKQAFITEYEKQCSENRAKGLKVKWEVSLGWDASGREPVVREAYNQGLISEAKAKSLVYGFETLERKAIEKPKDFDQVVGAEMPEEVKAMFEKLKKKVAV